MRIEQLTYLIEIADSGSFMSAAERLHIAQPSISQAISALESELNVTLLTRTRTGTEPTQAGLIAINHARHVLEEIDRIKDIGKGKHTECSTVTIVSSVAPISTFLPAAISCADIDRYKGRIALREGSAHTAERLLTRGEADFAVVPYIE